MQLIDAMYKDDPHVNVADDFARSGFFPQSRHRVTLCTMKRELICLLLFTCNYVVSVWRGFLFLWVLGMGYVILLWNSLSLSYNYFAMAIRPLTICLIKPLHCLRIRAVWLIPIKVHPSHVISFHLRQSEKSHGTSPFLLDYDTG